MPSLVTAIVGAISAGVTYAATAVGLGAYAASITTALLQVGATVLVNLALDSLFGTQAPSAQDIARKLSLPTTAPSYRNVYGETRATGTPAGLPVKGVNIWGAWILNSRPSDLSTFTLYLDKRSVALTGDAFDLSGAGATATIAPFLNHVTVWVSRGDHTTPPVAFTDDAAYDAGVRDDLWKTTDAWKGLTMIWLKLDAGEAGERPERWPSVRPLVEVEGRWSELYDDREASHDPDDPNTWEWSKNHCLCVRDALRQNPIRVYPEDQLHASFNVDGPNDCDQTVLLNSGGTEARYTASGTVLFDIGEIEDQLTPLMVSGAANFIRVGGRLGYASGVYRAPSLTLAYVLGSGFQFPDMVPGGQLVNRMRVTYLSPERGYETAPLKPWDIPSALAVDGGVPTPKTLDLPFCTSPTQAMRVRKIIGLRQRRQQSITGGELPPEAFNLVGGSTFTLGLPSPYTVLNGVYELQALQPGLDPLGASGQLGMRIPASFIKHSSDIYAWDETTEEETIFNEPYVSTRSGTIVPGALSVTTGDTVNLGTGGGVFPRILFEFSPSPSEVATYEWELRLSGGDYYSGGTIDHRVRNGAGKVFGFVFGSTDETYDIRVKALGPKGVSNWVEIPGVSPVVGVSLDAPVSGSATGGSDQIVVGFTTPNDSQFRSIEIFGSDTDDLNAASLVGSATFASQNQLVNTTESGLGTSKTRYYFARSRGDFSSASDFTASVTATTNA